MLQPLGNRKIRATLKEEIGRFPETWRDPLEMTSDSYLCSFRVERNNDIGNELWWMPRKWREGKRERKKTRNEHTGYIFSGGNCTLETKDEFSNSQRDSTRKENTNVGKKEREMESGKPCSRDV